MPEMPWVKAPQPLIDLFESVVPGPPAEQRKMFGYPACFANGNMFMGLYQHYMILRLPEPQRDELCKQGAKPFEPMPGRFMREYVTVPQSLLSNRAKLAAWARKSLEYGLLLPPKTQRAKSKRAKPAKRTSKSGR
ncbi:MAG: TfoX/Sxy family protein [Candidatus Binataceae bacterium]